MSSDLYFQLFLAVFLGAAMGLERTISHKTAGMRTFALVTLGSTLFSIISGLIGPDPARIAAQVVVGIGFLGAGLIVMRHDQVWGLTTAAGLWVAAAIGMAIGYRFYAAAIATTVMVLFIFLVLWRFEERFLNKQPLRERHKVQNE